MKRKFVQFAALCLAAALMAGLTGGTASAAPVNSSGRIIRVGLHYGTGAIEGLNLKYEAGSGFRFGYYDSANRFVELGTTNQQSISVVETQNVWYGNYGGYACYYRAVTSGVAVGEYHLQLPGVYNTFAEAQMTASQYSGGFPAYIGGAFYARVGNYTTRDGAVAAQSALAAQGVETTLAGTSAYGLSVVATGTSTILFQYDDNGNGTGLGVEAIQTGAEKATTWSKGYLYNGGFRFERINGGDMTVVNMVELEDYVKGVVPYEMSDSWPLEALKAQAVAARSYALALGTKHGKHHFDICDDTDCQVYQGRNKAGASSDAAVDQTAGQAALYNGAPIQAFFYSSNGGASESVSNVWGSNQSQYPYLVGVVDPYEAAAGINNYWERTFTSAQIISRVLAGYNVSGSIVSAAVTAYTDVGNPKMITFTDSAGKSYSVSSNKVFKPEGLGLPSFRFGFASGGGTSQPAPTTPATPSTGGVTVNGSTAVNGTSGLYAIDGNGNLSILGNGVYAITDSGTTLLGQGGGQNQNVGQGGNQDQNQGNEWSSSATAVNGSLTFAGRGWGHNIGLSQYGAYAMAQQGYTYQQILQFYYTGITVGYM